MISASDVISLTDRLDDAGIRYWLGGGWGVDALLGTQTRDHDDLDISVSADQEALVLATLGALDFKVSTDWRPVRVALRDAAGREVDVHPILEGVILVTDGDRAPVAASEGKREREERAEPLHHSALR